MDRQKFRKEFIEELAFFSKIANRYSNKEYTKEEIDEKLINFSSSFYGARLNDDKYAIKKGLFIATYPRQVYDGGLDNNMIDELCDNIEEENRIRGL